MKPRLNDC